MLDSLESPTPRSRVTSVSAAQIPSPRVPPAVPAHGTRPLTVATLQELIHQFPGPLTLGGTARPPIERALTLARVAPQQIADALVGRNPIGTTVEQWDGLLGDLGRAIRSEGLGDIQVGVSGTSVQFLSDNGVLFPTHSAQVWEQAVYYNNPASLPSHHFWNSKSELGIAWRKSDYDLNFYGAGIDQRMAEFGEARGITPDELVSPHGQPVFKVKYMRLAFPEVATVLKQWGKTLGRPVDITAKAYTGPDGRPQSFHDLTERCAANA